VNFRYPIFLDLSEKKCLVVGEGYEIAAKIQSLLAVGARVRYVSPHAEDAIQELSNEGRIVWERRPFTSTDLDGCMLVIADLPDNAELFRLAEERNILCNAVDDPDHCRFSFGSVHRSGDLTVAISTNGTAPALAVRLRQRLEREIGPEYGALLSLLAEIRNTISAQFPDFNVRRELWYRIVDSPALDKLRAGDHDGAAKLIQDLIESASSTSLPDTSSSNAGQ
jgi:siroheme synthase-like protein